MPARQAHIARPDYFCHLLLPSQKLFKDLGGQYLPYVQNRATPAIGANAAFLALAVVFLLTFILWRMMRYCCFMICCKASCDVKRSKRDADGILFNRRTKVLKVSCMQCRKVCRFL